MLAANHSCLSFRSGLLRMLELGRKWRSFHLQGSKNPSSQSEVRRCRGGGRGSRGQQGRQGHLPEERAHIYNRFHEAQRKTVFFESARFVMQLWHWLLVFVKATKNSSILWERYDSFGIGSQLLILFKLRRTPVEKYNSRDTNPTRFANIQFSSRDLNMYSGGSNTEQVQNSDGP